MKLAISDVWKWAAKDKSNTWWFYKDIPKLKQLYWATSDGDFASACIFDFPECDWQDSLHQIVNGELVKHVELKVDDKVMVKASGSNIWYQRYFNRFNGDLIECFYEGTTSWSSRGTVSTWDEWRLPTPEELA